MLHSYSTARAAPTLRPVFTAQKAPLFFLFFFYFTCIADSETRTLSVDTLSWGFFPSISQYKRAQSRSSISAGEYMHASSR